MMKPSKNRKLGNATRLTLNHETLRTLDTRELIAAVGGASGGVQSTICTNTHTSADIGCCTL